jgi:hypothetical protein
MKRNKGGSEAHPGKVIEVHLTDEDERAVRKLIERVHDLSPLVDLNTPEEALLHSLRVHDGIVLGDPEHPTPRWTQPESPDRHIPSGNVIEVHLSDRDERLVRKLIKRGHAWNPPLNTPEEALLHSLRVYDRAKLRQLEHPTARRMKPGYLGRDTLHYGGAGQSGQTERYPYNPYDAPGLNPAPAPMPGIEPDNPPDNPYDTSGLEPVEGPSPGIKPDT